MAHDRSTTATGEAFEEEVAVHYRNLGYAVDRNVGINGQRVDLLATRLQPDGQPYRVMIECKYLDNRTAGNAAIQSIAHAYELARKNEQVQACVIVTNNGFTIDAKRDAAAAHIHLLTSADLTRLSDRTPWPYALALSRDYADLSDRVPLFMHGQGRATLSNKPIPNVTTYLYERATTAPAGFTILFAGPGTGKTTQLIKLADKLAKEYLAGLPVPLGIYIPLERFTRHRDAKYFDHFVVDYLRTQYRMPNISWIDIATWLAKREAVLLLDGFDEIKHLDTPSAVLGEFEHIGAVVSSKTTAIVSCRTALAATAGEPLISQLATQLTNTGHPSPEVAFLDLFTNQDVVIYLDRANASKSLLDGRIAQHVLRRPVFLKLALDTLDPSARDKRKIGTEADLLERCVYQLLRRSSLRHSTIHPDQWRTFLEECALHMMVEELKSIDTRWLTAMVKSHFQLRDDDLLVLQQASHDARVRTVLDFSLTTNGLTWAHAIFRDYFAASAIALRLLQPRAQDRELEGRWLSPEITAFVRHCTLQMAKQWPELTRFHRPTQAPPWISHDNTWQWISPGLGLHTDEDTPGARLVFFRKGFWTSAQPLSHSDIARLNGDCAKRNLQDYAGSTPIAPTAPLTSITYEEAALVAASFAARLPTEEEWERSAKWVDGSFPTAEVLPPADAAWELPPQLGRTPPNPWGVRNAAGCIWQWTSAYDDSSQHHICRGTWWGAVHSEKLAATRRLKPREPHHLRTGVRLVVDAVSDEL